MAEGTHRDGRARGRLETSAALMASLYIETFGCQMNEADSQYIADRATSAGYAIAGKPEEANVLVVNTCTVRENAQRRAYGRINHFKALKDADPALRLVVTGCLAEQDHERMRVLAPHVDAVFGTRELGQLADQLAAWQANFADQIDFADQRALVMPLGGSADAVADEFSPLRAFVNVQRGCSYYCTFCIVPHVRGRFDHRPIATIVDDAKAKIAAGAREVTLVGQTVNAWKDPVAGADFGDLCRAVGQLAGLERLTFISPHPNDFSEKIIADLAAVPELNPRIHLPLQSGSDAVLRRMNRKYTAAGFAEKVALIRRYLPYWAITTDLIVGFPGESDEDFELTLDYVRSGIFANAFMFMYSPRRGTPAARWEPVPVAVVRERFNRLAEAQNSVSRAHHDRKVGAVVRALVQGPSKKDRSKIAAKAPDNTTVIASLSETIRAEDLAGTPWIDVSIDAGHVWGCTGTIVSRAKRFSDTGIPVPPPAVDLVAV